MSSPLHLGGRFGRLTRDPFSAPIADLSGRCGRPRDRHSRPRGSRCSEAHAPAISGLSLRGRGARFTRDAGNGRLAMGPASTDRWAARDRHRGRWGRRRGVPCCEGAHAGSRGIRSGSPTWVPCTMGEAQGGGAADAISLRSAGWRERPAWTGRAWGGRNADMRWRPYRRGTRGAASWRHGRARTRQASSPERDRGHSRA
jgi:hypothetical protein